ncbi:EF-hand domain-containing protein [Pontivivens ytuae]|uniref:EF-hand domain-containing protein n=1 Tax=Pontivivens ytuae TaxID=2789856 RepID=A0A7S9LT45_9RHOB|nr:EF-hand domain-containing protein [Pontivivens ytuae]QPH54812.1 EF-hand domain-containing protein [Pontivivens ytuae]
MKRPAFAALALSALLLNPALAQTLPQHDAGRAMGENFAQRIDADTDGIIGEGELLSFGEGVFASIDTDGDGTVSLAEMRDWRYGMADLAEFRERTQAYETSIAVLFDMFDRNNDGSVSVAEHEHALRMSSRYADLDEDGVLSWDEYLEGFIFNIAMRNALTER